MEGPYLSIKQKGAIDEKYIRNPDPAEYRALVELADGAIARWTVAPELDGAMEMGDYLTAHHILPSIGHSDAEYAQVVDAFHHGFTHVTHLYSGMSTIVRKHGFRFLGVTESAYALEDLTVEIIADGCHLPPELLRMVYRMKGPDKVCLVCDSMRCAGTDATETELGSRNSGRRVIVEDGVAKLPDRSAFAGSVATDDRLVRVMHDKAGVPLYDCINMMCLTPAKIMGLDGKKGSLEAGKDADLVLFDDGIDVKTVFVGGKIVFQKEG
jgi:N-acetylglucosamine-6-phosphate deacetylase